MPRMRMNQAIAAAIADEMRENPDVILLGEDVAGAGGPFKTSDGLLEEFGPLRVRDTPIAEMGFMGAAVGAAATGLRPVAEIMFVEFLGVALDMLVTEAAKFSYLSNGKVPVPMTVRASVGAGLGFGCQHSQVMESWIVGAPGLKIVFASGPANAYGLLRAAIRDDNPVAVMEPRILYAVRGEVSTGAAAILEIGKAATLTSGDDVTLLGLGSTVRTCAQAAAEADGWSADVVDLQTLQPWDTETVLESVRRTGRLAVVEESPYSGGWGADIVAKVVAEAFGDLKAPPIRITAPDVHVPHTNELELRYLPSADYVSSQVGELLATGAAPPHWWERRRALA